MIDHLVYAAADLALGMEQIEQLIGITPTLGGQHPGRGTRNALLALGADRYLEIVAPDPDQPPPPSGRWLGVDDVRDPRLTTWAAKHGDLARTRARALEHGVALGEVKSGTRQRTDGVRLSWQLTEPDPLVGGGVIPFLIDWGASPHPAHTAAQGASLVDFRLEHPDVGAIQRMLRVLDVDVPVSRADKPALVAMLEGPRGRVELR